METTPAPPHDPAALRALARRSHGRFLWHYARRYPLHWALGLAALLGTAVFAAQIPWVIRDAIEAMRGPDPTGAVPPLARWLILYALLQGAFRVASRTIVYFAAREIEHELRNDLFAHLLGLGISFYDRTPSGQVLSRAANDTSDIRLALGAGFIQILNTVFSVGAALFMMVRISAELTAYTVAFSPVLLLAFRYLSRRNYRLSKHVQQGLAALSAKVTENLTGLATVQAHGQEAREIAEFEALDAGYRDDSIRLAKYRAATWPLTMPIVGMTTVVLLVIGGGKVIAEEMTPGDFVAFQVYAGMLQWPMIGFGWVLNVLQRGRAAMDRLRQLFEIESEVRDPPDPAPFPADLGEGLVIEGLDFAYPRRGLEDLVGAGDGEGDPGLAGPPAAGGGTRGGDPEAPVAAEAAPVLRDLSLTVAPGERVALVGKIGSGKSTLVKLLARLYAVADGAVRIGGTDLNRIGLRALRAEVGFVPQGRFLFRRSLAENLKMGDPAADEATVTRYARMAQLDKDVAGFPDGYETLIGERGVTLSGGQRQRASLARALLKEPKILVLDDTFSAVDTDTEEEILKALRRRDPDQITLMITHRPSTMREADRIFVLDAGRVVQRGTHAQLAGVPGAYRDLIETAALRDELGLGEGAGV